MCMSCKSLTYKNACFCLLVCCKFVCKLLNKVLQLLQKTDKQLFVFFSIIKLYYQN